MITMCRVRLTWCVALSTLLVLWCASLSSVPAVAQAKRSVAMEADAHPGLAVSTVKPSSPDQVGGSFESEGNRIQGKNVTLLDMLLVAYHVHSKQVVDAPDWISKERFDISGVPDVPGEPNLEQVSELFRKLLAERFQLKLHRDVRSIPIYSLTIAKGGPKLTPADSSGSPNTGNRSTASRRSLFFRNMSMEYLALNLSMYEDRPVIDNTGLPGRYDFPLTWTPDDAPSPDADAPPSLFTAIKEQAGLKLEAVRGPSPVLVIDQVERPSPD